MRSRSFLARLGYRPYPWVLLAASLCLTVYSSLMAYRQVGQESRQRFVLAAGEIKTRLEDRISAYEQVLLGARGLFAADVAVSRQVWHRFVESLELQRRFRGIQGLGYALHLAPGSLPAHELDVAREGFEAYRVWPSGQRDEYSAIVYLEPFNARNQRAFGFDMLSEPVRRQALQASRDSGQITATGKVTLVQETGKDTQPGFLIYLPVYRGGADPGDVERRRAELLGWVYAPFRMGDLMDGILGALQQQVHLHLYDGAAPSPANLLYDNRPEGAAGTGSELQLQYRIDVAGHPWTLALSALPGFSGFASGHGFTALVMAGGSLVSLLLFAIAKSLVGTQMRARAIAAELTQSLRKSRELHHRIVTLAHEGILAVDTRFRVTYSNPRLAELLGCPLESLIGRPVMELVETQQRALVKVKLENRRRGISESYEVNLLKADGGRVPVLLSAAPLLGEGGSFMGSFAMIVDISARKHAEAALQESESRFRSLANSASDAIISIDADGKVVSWNRAAETIFGYSEESILGNPVSQIMPPELARQHQAFVSAYLQRGVPRVMGKTVQLSGRRRSGEDFPLELSLSEWSLDGRRYFGAIIRDITERMRAAEALTQSEERLRRAILNAPVPMALHAEDGAILLLSETWQTLSGYSMEDAPTLSAWLERAQGRSPVEGEAGPVCRLPFAEGEVQICTRDGRWLIWDFHSSPLDTLADGRKLIVTTAMDVTERRANEARVWFLAHHDALTRLPNRQLLQERVERALSMAKRKWGRLALIYFDIDHFKRVNDELGHDVGDALLVAAAQRLRDCVRDSDTLGRLGGDEFLALLPEISGAGQAASVAEKIRDVLARPFDLKGQAVKVSTSIGIALFPEHGPDFASLLKGADVAMYLAKGSGRDRCCFAAPAGDANSTQQPPESA
ncbi:sensor domain-containing diguanylate cyclase [Methyloterricola oryzae]|uniref:sensor domain-containing diguanylate cyclase n=1 Tax=Methyloterricola oryzae TaxID=1495050 RepID=UPI000699E5BC|nr:CHASE domain-containing protein [Methyloterricola oryzae]